jgi:hypothetical protein
MKKIIKIVAIVLIGGMLISKALEEYDRMQRKSEREQSMKSFDKTKSIGYQMVKNALESGNEVIEPGDDVEPAFNQPYRSDEDGDEWTFWRRGEVGVNGMLKSKQVVLRLKRIETGIYDTYSTERPDAYISEGYVIRMINDGKAIEVTKDKKTTTVYTLAE